MGQTEFTNNPCKGAIGTMKLKNQVILVLGGYGLVGMAVCRQLMEKEPRALIISSLLEDEARKAVDRLRAEFSDSPVELVPVWGNVFVRASLKDMTRPEVLANADNRRWVFEDVLAEMSPATVRDSFLAQLVEGRSELAPDLVPDAIVDCINTATALAYQDIYTSAAEVLDVYDRAHELWRMGQDSSPEAVEPYVAAVERLLASIYVPQLVRHIQILHESMRRAGTRVYVKVGTSGTGGMGLNIPYTHGEEKPSRVLMSKAAMAGAHSLLLFLMGRTPDGPAIKEIKPSAAITWKQIGYGPIKKRGREIPLFDCPPEAGLRLDGQPFDLDQFAGAVPLDDVLQSVFIDTGENGYFSLPEFTAITTLGQMEGITPEDIAFYAICELEGVNTGRDVISALDGAVMGPSYRAGVLRHRAIEFAHRLEEEHGVDSVAFEILGPPKLSKLLFEAYMLKRTYGTMHAVAESDPEAISAAVAQLVHDDQDLRSRAISIGIPILMPDGTTLLCAPRGRKDHRWEWQAWNTSPETIDRWCETEWIDLRVRNMARWRQRMGTILQHTTTVPHSEFDSSSGWERAMFDPATWDLNPEINLGEVAGWIFQHEERGRRYKH
jgi:NAD(P)-dependent dehydrogenase (short-subunit alcohol dehydrogenase family)